MNEISKKILLLLDAGLVFSYAYIPGKKWQALEKLSQEWKKINEDKLNNGIRNLYHLDILEKVEHGHGLITVKLTERGRLRALNYKLENIRYKNKRWDGRWRMVAFDIPEKYRKGRDALRQKLNKIGFQKLQESVFITPYDCKKEIEMLVRFFRLERYVRFGMLDYIDNEDFFKESFTLK